MCSKHLTAEAFLVEVEEWIGTPYRHQARRKNLGCDCVGLIIGASAHFGVYFEDNTEYKRIPNGIDVAAALKIQLIEIPVHSAKPGDILLLTMARFPQHVAVLAHNDYIIHSTVSFGKVVKHHLNMKWRKRIFAAFRLPGV